MRPRPAIFAGIVLSAVLASGAAAAWADPIAFELYSWRSGDHWSFSVLEGTTTAKPSEAIRSPRKRLKNLTFLKGRLASLPAGSEIYWREDPSRGFRLPSKELVADIAGYADGAGLSLVLPDGRTAAPSTP